MRIDRMLVALFVSLLIVGFSQNTFAQRYEFNPYKWIQLGRDSPGL